MKIFITGGLGYIGSHIAVELLNAGHTVVIADNLSNSNINVHQKIKTITSKDCELYIIDLTDRNKLFDIFEIHSFYSIIHCAGLKSVNESIKKPLKYYDINLGITKNLLECVIKYNVKHFVFSSSATVYGGICKTPFSEDHPVGQNITNPYGWSKYFQEQMIRDVSAGCPDKIFILLRYFNPVGGHSSGLLYEDPVGVPNNLMPYIIRVARADPGYDKLTIFGDDYPTDDGTCVRDFIHVVDLARAHLMSLAYNTSGAEAINIGTGKGVSVKQLVDTFKKVNNVDFRIIVGEKRDGDPAVIICNASKAARLLGWSAQSTVEDMCCF